MSWLNGTQNELATPQRTVWRRPVFWIAVGAAVAVLLAVIIVSLLLHPHGGESLPAGTDSAASFGEISSLPSQDASSPAEPEADSSSPALPSQTTATSSAPASRPSASVTTTSRPPAVSSAAPAGPVFPIPDTAPLVDSPVEVSGDVSIWDREDLSDFLAYVDGWVYYRSTQAQLCRVRTDGSDQQVLCRNVTYLPVVIAENALYAIHWEYIGEEGHRCGIDKVDLRDLSHTFFPASEAVNKISVSGGRIVYHCNRSSSGEGALYAMRTDGSDCKKLTDQCVRFAHEGTRVFFSEREDSSLRMLYCNLESSAIQRLQLNASCPIPQLLKDGYLYFTMQHPTDIEFNRHKRPNTCLYRLKLEDFSMTKIVEHEGVNDIYGLQLQDGWLYYEREIGPNYYYPTYTLYRCRPDGTENTYLCVCGLKQRYQVEENRLYYSTYDDNDIVLRCLTLDGSRYETLYRFLCEEYRMEGFFLAQGKPFLMRRPYS